MTYFNAYSTANGETHPASWGESKQPNEEIERLVWKVSLMWIEHHNDACCVVLEWALLMTSCPQRKERTEKENGQEKAREAEWSQVERETFDRGVSRAFKSNFRNKSNSELRIRSS